MTAKSAPKKTTKLKTVKTEIKQTKKAMTKKVIVALTDTMSLFTDSQLETICYMCESELGVRGWYELDLPSGDL